MARRKKSEVISEISTEPVKIEDAIQAVESDPILVIEETPAEIPVDIEVEKPAKKAVPKKAAPKKESKPAEDVKAAPVTETPEDVEKPAEKKAAPKPAKKSLKAGQKLTIFAARLYPSSVAKTPRYLATGECFIIDTDEHDGRIRVSADEAGTKIGWADLNDLKG